MYCAHFGKAVVFYLRDKVGLTCELFHKTMTGSRPKQNLKPVSLVKFFVIDKTLHFENNPSNCVGHSAA